MNKKYSRYLFVVNPIAGDNEKEEFAEWISELVTQHGLDYKTYYTTGEGDETEIKNLIDSFKPEIVVAAGGDGTVNLVAHHLLATDIAMAIIPLGSGNGLAKDLKIPHLNAKDALELIVEPKVIEIDTLEANDNFFMHISDIGFNAHIVRLFNNGSSRGLLSYMKFTVKEFFKYDTFHYQIETDMEKIKGHAFMITIANSNQFGSNLTINPNGEYDDGTFEIIIIRRFPRRKILAIMWRLITKKINFSPYTRVLKCQRATIRTKKLKTLQADGEILGRVNEANIKIHHRSLKVVVPARQR